ncbi:hypothetical protein [Microbacterium rhizosphaerae]|uniref:Uncharacterized protein n=1 Tax=Microbacterium rhizosphaerae TaxID=1678237 RepID=A0ABZ0SKA0_9MICO|nr:hypothetical protein [Microbacterium rhizosphaerae]WPR88920.1 hypothetical protein SM116_14295 [Microbacterium rhizosphaerae]
MPGLLKHIDVPEDLVETHEMIRVYRNTTIAHSQSELSMSFPWVSLTPEGTVDRVVPFTIRPPASSKRCWANRECDRPGE